MASAKVDMLAALVTNGQRLVAMSGIALHVFTTATAYQLADPGVGRYFLTAAAFAYPIIAEAVVAYYAWQASGSKINGYSIWLLAWILLLLIVFGLAAIRKRLQTN